MFTALFLTYALLHVGLFIWLLRLYRETRAPVAALLILPQLGLIWDNGVVAAGSFLGFGALLEALSWPRFWIHWLMGCWLIIASASLLRMAGFEFARSKGVMAAFCLLTLAMMLHDLPNFWTATLHPVCQFDLVRYSTVVSEATRCSAAQPLVRGEPPIASIVTILVVLASGPAIWIRRGFPWFFAGGLLMFISATPPMQKYKLDNFGEVLIKGGTYWAIWHFTRDQLRQRVGGVSASQAA
jgi:hypothetical protein